MEQNYFTFGLWIKRHRRQISIVCAVILSLLLTGYIVRQQELRVQAKMKETQLSLAEGVLRFHVLANSDSENDQTLKMKVKERIIAYMKQELPDSHSLKETTQWAKDHESDLEQVAKTVIAEEGFSYPVSAEVTKSYFPDKTYGDVMFPSGEYDALRIEIGNAAGKNWWCVLYPDLCFIDSVNAVVPEEGKDELKQVLTEEEYEMVTATSDFKIKWFFFGKE